MKIQEKKKHTPLVHQLTGILPADADVEQEYGRYLEEKYVVRFVRTQTWIEIA